MSLSDLRKELRELRKTEARPVSRMKKHEVVLELEKRKGGKKEEPKAEAAVVKAVKKAEKIVEKAEAPKKVVRKVVEKVEVEKSADVKKKSKSVKA